MCRNIGLFLIYGLCGATFMKSAYGKFTRTVKTWKRRMTSTQEMRAYILGEWYVT
jgi:hypothetical protein